MKRWIFNLLFWGIIVGMHTGIAQESENPHRVLDRECNACHTPEGWNTIRFDHQQTAFPLTGQHEGVNCVACHSLADFREVQARCGACHIDAHQDKLGEDCQRCHTSRSWTLLDPLTAHASTTFPLLGKHGQLDCQACHTSEVVGEFSMTRSECFACHEAEFRSAQNPVHSSLGFGVRCEECHELTGWRPATFAQHDDVFPIFSGKHRGEWEDCTDCHTSPGNFLVFSCLNCHEHRQSKMDEEHHEVAGYVYESNACYACHPRGSE